MALSLALLRENPADGGVAGAGAVRLVKQMNRADLEAPEAMARFS
jgi:hypothetical protein